MSLVFTNFCCRSGGSNLNSGTLLGDTTVPGTSPSFSYTGTFATNTFTVSGANPVSDGVTAGMFAQVSDGTNIGRIARIASVTSSTIVLDGTASLVVNGGTYTQCRIGGAWSGQAGTSKFPLGISAALTNATGNQVRVNFCNDQTYTISSTTTVSANSITFQGYSSAYDDGGRCVWSGGSSGAAYTPWTFSGNDQTLQDIIFQNNGATGIAYLVNLQGTRQIVRNCDATGSRYSGFYFLGNDGAFINCKSYSNAQDGFYFTTACTFIRCISYSNNASGFNNGGANGTVRYYQCISYINGSHGLTSTGIGNMIYHCDFYNNTGSGVNLAGTSSYVIWWQEIENCNFILNGAYGIAQPSTRRGVIRNCGFGAGTAANVSGTIQSGLMQEVNSVTYPSNTTPWNSPSTGDFSITLSQAKNAGYGTFPTTTFAGHPDIGAVQHQDVASGGGIFGIGMNGGFD